MVTANIFILGSTWHMFSKREPSPGHATIRYHWWIQGLRSCNVQLMQTDNFTWIAESRRPSYFERSFVHKTNADVTVYGSKFTKHCSIPPIDVAERIHLLASSQSREAGSAVHCGKPTTKISPVFLHRKNEELILRGSFGTLLFPELPPLARHPKAGKPRGGV